MKKFLFAFLYATGVTRLAAWWYRHRVVFLCYHGVTGLAERSPSDPHGLHVRRERFENQLDFLRRRLVVRRQVQRGTGGTIELRAPKHGSERTVTLPDELAAVPADEDGPPRGVPRAPVPVRG